MSEPGRDRLGTLREALTAITNAASSGIVVPPTIGELARRMDARSMVLCFDLLPGATPEEKRNVKVEEAQAIWVRALQKAERGVRARVSQVP